jgi:hypothetical protein
VKDQAPIPFCVDRKGIVHATDAFRQNIYEHVDGIMENIMEDENLAKAREALEFFYEEFGLPEVK